MADPKKKIFVITAPVVVNNGTINSSFIVKSGAGFTNDGWTDFRANHGFVYLCHRRVDEIDLIKPGSRDKNAMNLPSGLVWTLELFDGAGRHIIKDIKADPPDSNERADEQELQKILCDALKNIGGCVLLMPCKYCEETLLNGDILRRRIPPNIVDRFAIACRAINAEVEFWTCQKDLPTNWEFTI